MGCSHSEINILEQDKSRIFLSKPPFEWVKILENNWLTVKDDCMCLFKVRINLLLDFLHLGITPDESETISDDVACYVNNLLASSDKRGQHGTPC